MSCVLNCESVAYLWLDDFCFARMWYSPLTGRLVFDFNQSISKSFFPILLDQKVLCVLNFEYVSSCCDLRGWLKVNYQVTILSLADVTLTYHAGGGGGFFSSLARILGEGWTIYSPPALFIIIFFKVEISLAFHSASWDDCGRVFPDELRVSSFSSVVGSHTVHTAHRQPSNSRRSPSISQVVLFPPPPFFPMTAMLCPHICRHSLNGLATAMSWMVDCFAQYVSREQEYVLTYIFPALRTFSCQTFASIEAQSGKGGEGRCVLGQP